MPARGRRTGYLEASCTLLKCMSGTANAGDALRPPLLIAALVAALIGLLLSLGSALVSGPPPFAARVSQTLNDPTTNQLLEQHDIDRDDAEESLNQTRPDDPPGLAIPAMALVLGELLLVLGLTALPLLIGDRMTGTVNGVVSIIGGLLLLLAAIATALLSLGKLLLMVGLLVSAPFGTLAYLALFGSFNTGAAATFTGLVMASVVGCLVLLTFAQQRFLQSKGLVALIATAALLTLIIGLLHSIVPGFLVSITDALGALIVAIIAAVWALCVLIWGVVAAVRILQLGKQSDGGLTTR